MIEKILENLAYSFFPKGVCFITRREEYLNSLEFKKLDEITNFYYKNANNYSYENLIFGFKSNNYLKAFKDVSMLNWHDRCFSFELDFNDGENLHLICLNISVLIPFYSIRVLENKINKKSFQWETNPVRNRKLETEKYKELVAQIEVIVENTLNYKKFPENILNIVIEDISFQDIKFGEFNFFNAFFLNDCKL